MHIVHFRENSILVVEDSWILTPNIIVRDKEKHVGWPLARGDYIESLWSVLTKYFPVFMVEESTDYFPNYTPNPFWVYTLDYFSGRQNDSGRSFLKFSQYLLAKVAVSIIAVLIYQFSQYGFSSVGFLN